MTTDEKVMTTEAATAATVPDGDASADKGKGKAAATSNPAADEHMDDAMDEDDSDEDEDDEPAQDEEDGMEEIDPSNIIGGRRTRGRVIDFAKAAEQNPPEADEDEEDDEDFQADDNDKMDED